MLVIGKVVLDAGLLALLGILPSVKKIVGAVREAAGGE